MTIDPELLTGLGAALAVFLSSTGAAIASSHSGIFAMRSNSFKDFVPIVISGVLAIYGIIVGVLLCGKFNGEMNAVDGYRNVSAGLSVGLACWASGYGMASFIRQCNEGKAASTRPTGSGERQPLLNGSGVGEVAVAHPSFVKLVFVMVFLEAIGLYGLIVALFLMG
jgi:V-type H+-transporting ATPase proteolipid subunit